MRALCTFILLLFLVAVGGAQQSEKEQSTVTVQSTLVEVPILAKKKS